MSLEAVFDNHKRKDYLGGFHKRKEQRKKRAREEIDKKLKEERAILKKKKLELLKKDDDDYKDRKSADAASFCQDVTKETIDLPSHKVSIIETDIFDPSLNLYLGENKDDEDEVDTNQAEETNDTADKKIYIKNNVKTLNKLTVAKLKLSVTKKTKMSSSQKKNNKRSRKYLHKKERNKRIAMSKKK